MNDLWSCRTDPLDGDLGRRWGHFVEFGGRPDKGEIAFLGLASDEGVRRNQGRPGAATGPSALRKAMANLAAGKQKGFRDLGDIQVINQDLEGAQERYAETGALVIDRGALFIGLGGGHEIAFASYRALRLAKPDAQIGMVYFDAHYDLREASQRTSGTPFRDILTMDKRAKALAIGISPFANTQRLRLTAHQLGVETWSDHGVSSRQTGELRSWLEDIDALYVSFDLDVLPAADAPGVSAPAGFGVPYRDLRPFLMFLAESGKLRAFDVAELNPTFDVDGRTARTAARIIGDVVEAWSS